MYILGIDTATRAASVAVIFDGKILAENLRETPQTFSETLMPQVEEVIKISGAFEKIDAVAVSIGPGSFTGLRIGLATAKALAYAWNVKIIGVPTLQVLAENFPTTAAEVMPLIDAQKNRAYRQIFRGGEPVTELEIKAIDEAVAEAGRRDAEIFLCGDALSKIKNPLPPNVKIAPPNLRIPRAACVALRGKILLDAGKVDNVMNLEPLYVRRAEAEVLWEKRQALLKSAQTIDAPESKKIST